MSTQLTQREQEYLDCETPMLSGKKAAVRVVGGFFASFGQALVMPTTVYTKADKGLVRTIREIRYTKYKKAVLRKKDGKPYKKDKKLLKKLNEKDFILAEDTFDADEYTKRVYEEYMKRQEELRAREEK